MQLPIVLSKNSDLITSTTTFEEFLKDVKSKKYAHILDPYVQACVDANENKLPKPPKPNDLPAILPMMTGLDVDDERGGITDGKLREGKRHQLSGIFCIDVDNLSGVEIDKVKAAALDDDEICAFFTSPSGRGVKLFGYHDLDVVDLFRDTFREYSRHWITSKAKLDISKYDGQPTNLNSLCYIGSGDVVIKSEDDYSVANFLSISDLIDVKNNNIAMIDAGLLDITNRYADTSGVDSRYSAASLKKHTELLNDTSNGSGKIAYSYARTLAGCGYMVNMMVVELMNFRGVCQAHGRKGNWDPALTAKSGMQNPRTIANTAVMSTRDRRDYDKLMNERIAISCRSVLVVNVPKEVVSMEVPDGGFSQDHIRLMAEDNMELLYSSYERFIKTMFLTNAGGAKTYSSGLLVDRLVANNPNFKCVFLTHTHSNKKEWIAHNPNFVNILGVTELLIDQLPVMDSEEESIFKAYVSVIFSELKQVIIDYNIKHKDNPMIIMKDMSTISSDVARRLSDEGFAIDVDLFIEDRNANNMNMDTSNLITMTHAKWEHMGGGIKKFNDYFIIYDEITALPARPTTGVCEVWGHTYEVAMKESTRRHLDTLMNMQDMNVLFMSCESGVKYNLSGTFGAVNVIDGRVNLIDKHLTTVVIPSTSNEYGKLQPIYDYVAGMDDVMSIGNKGGDMSHLGVKGSNAFKESDTVVVATYPHPQDIASIKLCCRLDDSAEGTDTAVRIIISNMVNQSVGRNTGYRQSGKRCLVILSQKMKVKQHTTGEFYNIGDELPSGHYWYELMNKINPSKAVIKAGYIDEAIAGFVSTEHYTAKEGKMVVGEVLKLHGKSSDYISRNKMKIWKEIKENHMTTTRKQSDGRDITVHALL